MGARQTPTWAYRPPALAPRRGPSCSSSGFLVRAARAPRSSPRLWTSLLLAPLRPCFDHSLVMNRAGVIVNWGGQSPTNGGAPKWLTSWIQVRVGAATVAPGRSTRRTVENAASRKASGSTSCPRTASAKRRSAWLRRAALAERDIRIGLTVGGGSVLARRCQPGLPAPAREHRP